MFEQSIGLIGGFGAYATLGFYQRLINAFMGQSERELPHILIDCDFTMPSRTKALLYDEEGACDIIIDKVSVSVKRLIDAGADYIVFVCGTAHYFLDDVYRIVPECKGRVVNIIETLDNELIAKGLHSSLVIAAEGALRKKVYPKYLKSVECIIPSSGYYEKIRYFIEAVKNNAMSDAVVMQYRDFLRGFNERNIILGCTEFPVLTNYSLDTHPELFDDFVFYDPLESTIRFLKNVMK